MVEYYAAMERMDEHSSLEKVLNEKQEIEQDL